MKLLAIIAVLMSCQQIFAAQHSSFKEFKQLHSTEHTARTTLDELKAKIAKDLEGLPAIQEPDFMKMSYEEMKSNMNGMPAAPLPDFAARKATLAGLKAKLSALSAGQSTTKPNKAFFDEIQKTLVESMQVKMVDFKLAELSEEELNSKPVVDKVPGAQKRVRNLERLENFYESMLYLQEGATELHRLQLEDARITRHVMVDNVYDIYGDMTYNLAFATQRLWEIQQTVQDVIDYDESVGASEACVEEQKNSFAGINIYFGSQMNWCTNNVYYPGRTNINNIFYPTLQSELIDIGSVHYLILQMMARTNIARDQYSLIVMLDSEINALQARWNDYSAVVLNWEMGRFVDSFDLLQTTLNECVGSLVVRYDAAATYIKNALGRCTVPYIKK